MGADRSLISDELRLTGVGKFLRSTSIDELPQLINVLKGDLALIGSRSLLVQYLPLYSKEQARCIGSRKYMKTIKILDIKNLMNFNHREVYTI